MREGEDLVCGCVNFEAGDIEISSMFHAAIAPRPIRSSYNPGH